MTLPIVLLVEDDRSIALIMGLLLKAHKFEVHHATNAADAINVFKQVKAELLICDFHLAGGQSGRDLVATLRQIQPDLPSILMSGDFAQSVEICNADGLVCLGKPFREATLLEAIQKAGKKSP